MTIDVALSPSPRVSVIIPATASFDLLLATLRSLSLHGPQHIPFETIVVLNESVAAEESRLHESVTGIHVIASTVNLGLAGAGNRGRSIAKGELLILLHDDAEIDPGWMEALVETADAHSEAGAIGGKVLWPDGRLQNAGMILFRNGGTSAPWFGDAPPPTAFDRVRAVDYCGTSSLLVRADAWDAIGGLDERFYPVYYVDVDLAMAIRQLGRVVLYQPQSQIRHHAGASGSRRWRIFLQQHNRQLFIDKWGNALDDYESADSDFEGAIERATARAESFVAKPLALQAHAAVPALCDRAYAEKERSVRSAYITHLEESVDVAERERAVATQAETKASRELAELRESSLYLLGTRLSFASGGNAYRYQCTGGYEPEDWGVWLGAEPLTIALPLVGRNVPESRDEYNLELETLPFVAEGRATSPMTVSLNGDKVLDVDETLSGVKRYEVPIRFRSGATIENLVITVEGADATSPAAIAVNGDDRFLTVGLIALALVAHR